MNYQKEFVPSTKVSDPEVREQFASLDRELRRIQTLFGILDGTFTSLHHHIQHEAGGSDVVTPVESDPIFVASTAYGITGTQITHWETAYGWGNHASAGYLTSFTEADPIFVASAAYGISGTQITNWTTAYGWGNHASAGYYKSGDSPNFAALVVDTTTLVVDAPNNRVGFGVAAPDFQVHMVAPNDASGYNVIDAYGDAVGVIPSWTGRKARGSKASPTAIQADNTILAFGGRAYGASAFSAGAKAYVTFKAAETWTDAAQGTYITLETTPIGSTTRVEVMRVKDDGTVKIGTLDGPLRATAGVIGVDAEVYAVGDIYITTVATNPATTKGYGTWALFGTGRVLIGVDTGDADFNTVEKTGGYKTRTASAHTGTAVGAHDALSHTNNHAGTTVSAHTYTAVQSGTGINVVASPNGGHTVSAQPTAHGNHTLSAHSVTQPSDHSAFSIVQPYITVYMWKRTA